MFGHGAALGLGAAPEYSLCAIATPVGAYYKGGLQPIDAVVVEGYDRAAPRGVGSIKCAGNYAPDVLPSRDAKARRARANGGGVCVCVCVCVCVWCWCWCWCWRPRWCGGRVVGVFL
jgi:hypothetical protein